MIVGMVDDRAMRLRQGTPAQPEPSPLDSLVQNYLRTSGRLAEDQVKYGGQVGGLGSRTADLLVNQGVSDSPGLRAGALVGDIALDPGWLIPGVGAAKGVAAGARVARDPTVQARANAIMGRLYHGNRNEPWSVATSRPFDERMGNWFSADLFSTPDFKLASSYGPEAVFSLKNLPPNLKVLDLMPGGKTVAQQSPELAESLSRLMGGNAPFDDVTDLARHTSLTSLPNDELARLMQQQGFNALRHVSGQGIMAGTGRAKPVYAFFDPAGITANPVTPLNRALNQAGEAIVDPLGAVSDISNAARNTVQRVGGRFVDSVDEAVRQSGSANPRIQQFLAERGTIAPGYTSSTGTPRRIFVDPDTGRTLTTSYSPYPAVSGALSALAKPNQIIRSAREATQNAYQRLLDEYSALEQTNRNNFLQNYYSNFGNSVPYGVNLPGAPMPPGYRPLPKPAEPGALDFLQYLFNAPR